MEIIWIIVLAVLAGVIFTLYIRSSFAIKKYQYQDEFSERSIKDLKDQVSHYKHHYEMHEKAFKDAETKIKQFGFSGVDDFQLQDAITVEEMSKIKVSLEADAKIRTEKKILAEIASQLELNIRIRELADTERARIAIIRSKEEAAQEAKKYLNQGAYKTDSDGLMSFVPLVGAVAYDGGAGFSGSGGSFSDGGGYSSGGDSGGSGGGGE